jgi:hypothetical protein
LSISVEITSLRAPGGGGWNWQGYGKMGLKQIRTTLYDKQDVAETVNRTTEYKGGAFKYFRTTCGILMQAVDKLAADTTEVLQTRIGRLRFRRGDDLQSGITRSP